MNVLKSIFKKKGLTRNRNRNRNRRTNIEEKKEKIKIRSKELIEEIEIEQQKEIDIEKEIGLLREKELEANEILKEARLCRSLLSELKFESEESKNVILKIINDEKTKVKNLFIEKTQRDLFFI